MEYNKCQGNRVISWKVLGEATLDMVIRSGFYEKLQFQKG